MDSNKDVILVTGSSGLIGAATIRRLAPHFTVIGFDRAGDPHPPKEAECVCVDLTSDASVEAGLARVRYAYGHRIASVIHLAAYYDFSGEPSPKYEQVTVRGTERLLRELHAFEVEQFIFSSTMLVHASAVPGERITEESPLDPRWDYPKSKVETEGLIRAERGNIPIVLLRIAGVYDEDCHSIPLAHQIQRIYERRLTSHLFPGHIAHGQAFIHLEDLVEAFLHAVQRRRELAPELTLLLGEPETLSYDELQHQLGRLIHGEDWETREIPKSVAKTGAWVQDALPLGEEPFIKPWMIDFADDHYALDISRVREVLGWGPKHSLRETLPEMIGRVKVDPLRWYRENHLEPPPELESGSGSRENAMTHDHDGPAGASHRPAQHEAKEQWGEMHEMMREQHEQWLWRDFTNILLGVWLAASPFTWGYQSAAMTWSDVVSGTLIVGFGVLSLSLRLELARWGICAVGLWLLFAPLVFWAPDPSAYATDTLIGGLAIALSVLIPMMPGKAHHMVMMQPGPDLPPGWSYNPSTWQQRAPVIGLAFVGFFIARYLAAYQLGYIDRVWDPVFGEGTRRVLESEVSRAWPISDAGLGALSYLLEALSGFMGGVRRWRTMPWMVAMFGFLVIPLGVTSIVLVMLQPVTVGDWCTLCLITAVAMVVMIPFAVDEVVAMFQFLAESRREGQPFWRTFWVGGTLRQEAPDPRTPRLTAPLAEVVPAMGWGVTAPWSLLVSAALGIWLMAAPAVFNTQGALSDSSHVVGALVVTIAATAMAEVTRAARFLNVLLGAWLAVAPWLLSGASPGARWHDAGIGAALILLSLPRGRVRERYGKWQRYVA